MFTPTARRSLLSRICSRAARTAPTALTGLALGGLLIACSASGTNFKTAAEKVINEEISKIAGLSQLEGLCDKPANTEVGETFKCTAETEDGETIAFIATIGKEDRVEVESTNLIIPDGLEQIEAIAVRALEQEIGQTLGAQNFDCGRKGVVIDVDKEVLTCTLTDPDSGLEYDAEVDIPDLSDPSDLTVTVADTPRG